MPLRRQLLPLALGLAASLLVLLLQAGGLLTAVELVSMDTLMTLRGAQPADPRVVICDIDAASIDAYGRWPWPRSRVAELIEGLDAAGAAVIALDVVFAEPSRRDQMVDLSFEDQRLAEAVAGAGNVVLGYFFRRQPPAAPLPGAPTAPGGDPANLRPTAIEQVLNEPPGGFAVPQRPAVEPNIDLLAEAADSQGFFSNERLSGVLRHYDLVVRYDGRYYPALALRAAERLEGGGLRLEAATGAIPRLLLGGQRLVTDERGALWVSYRGPAGSFATYPAVEVLTGRAPADAFTGRIVFIGASETGIGDLYATPFGSEIPGVEVHAHVADNLLNHRFIRDTGVQATISFAALLLLGPLVALLVGLFSRPLVGALSAIALTAAWPLACLLAFTGRGWHLSLVAPAAAGLLSLVLVLPVQLGLLDRRARTIKGVFRRYVSEGIVEQMLRDPQRVKLGGERREMTVLFCDLRGFTSVSERLGSEEVSQLLNRFFTPMTREVLAAGGTLDKYMGDALMAFFGAPVAQGDHAERACRAALAMRRELARLNGEGALPGGVKLALGIGLSSGEMSVGNMGSEEIFDYTVIGDNVNLGSRIEGLNKVYGTEILASEATVRVVQGFFFRELDRVRVKGREEPVTLFELVCETPASAEVRQKVTRFAAGLTAYRERDFFRAERLFASILEDLGDDGPCRRYVQRCRQLRDHPPPEGWDPVTRLTSK